MVYTAKVNSALLQANRSYRQQLIDSVNWFSKTELETVLHPEEKPLLEFL
jgi:hypothetical protein